MRGLLFVQQKEWGRRETGGGITAAELSSGEGFMPSLREEEVARWCGWVQGKLFCSDRCSMKRLPCNRVEFRGGFLVISLHEEKADLREENAVVDLIPGGSFLMWL